jgi:two-component system chemotaxis response regulator CheY
MSGTGKGQLCLIVDDSRTVRRIARTIIEQAGMRAAEAADGDEGLTACRSLRPDYVLLDWNMPRVNGIDCLKAIRREFGDTLPRVILCTTENDPEHIIAANEAGAQEFIMKPFDAEILLGKIADVAIASEAAA